MMSISFQGKIHFWAYLWNQKSFAHETKQANIVLTNVFKKDLHELKAK